MFDKCDRCHAQNAKSAKLFGGFNAEICSQCANEWHIHITSMKRWKNCIAMKAEFEAVIQSGHRDSAGDMALELEEIRREFFVIGASFIAENVKRPGQREIA